MDGPPQPPPAPTAEPLVLDLARRLVPRMLLGGVVGLVLGLGLTGLLASEAADAVDRDETSGLVIGAVIAAILVAAGLFCLWVANRSTGILLVLDDEGLHWEDPRRPWDLRWQNVDAVGLSVTVWAPPRSAATFGRGSRTGRVVVAVRDPADPAVRGAVARMRTGDEPAPWTHWITLGTNQDWIAAADETLARLLGERYAGVSERETLRRRYS